MAFSRAKFLIEVLGPDGAKALAKAADRSEDLAQALVPRTIIAWLRSMPSFDGEIPGLPGQTFSFQKSEGGFSGSVAIGGANHQFQDATIFHVAGAVATAMELDSLVFGNVRNLDLERLGKSIDLMAKVRQAVTLSKEKCPDCGGKNGGHLLHCKSKLEKKAINEGGSGAAAAPIAPQAPDAPTSATKSPAAKPMTPKTAGPGAAPKPLKPAVPALPSVKLTRSESNTACPVCFQKQFGEGQFVGCLCFRALSKSVKIVGHDDNHIEVEFGEGWDRDTLTTLLESVGRK